MWSDAVIMIRPTGIDFNVETAGDNTFQSRYPGGVAELRAAALAEFDGLARQLRYAGVDVYVAEPPAADGIPDAVFPNNWFSTHADGTVVWYPMAAANRRAERRESLFDDLAQAGYQVNRRIDLSSWEHDGVFLEGTGSLVLDRAAKVAYASLSPRTTAEGVARWCRLMGYQPCVFHAVETKPDRMIPIYHTNVVLSLGVDWAVLCLESLVDADERSRVQQMLRESGREIVAIDRRQMQRFAGNILQLRAADSPQFVVAMSVAAQTVFRPEQWRLIADRNAIVATDISTIESCGGGSVRCMLAENFLPRVSLGAKPVNAR